VRTIVPILAYHSVSDASRHGSNEFTVTPQQLADHLDYIAHQGYTALRVSDFAETVESCKPLPSRPILLTFDDGYADFYSDALPLLAARGYASTLYMITGQVLDNRSLSNQRPRFLSWAELREIDAAGVEIGSHSETHPQLDVLTHAHAHAEIQTSKAVLQAQLGHDVRSFAYPYGYHGPAVRRLVIAAGYRSACAVKEALSASDDDIYALSRILIRADTRVPQLHALLTGGKLRVAPTGEQLATRGWRYVRRSTAILDRALAKRRAARAS